MVALTSAYLPELIGPGRIGFVATNGRFDCVVIEGAAQDEYMKRLKEGWRVVEVRPICRSLHPKLLHNLPALQAARAWSYSLVVMEHSAIQAQPPGCAIAPMDRPASAFFAPASEAGRRYRPTG